MDDDDVAEVSSRSPSSAEPIFAHTSAAPEYKDGHCSWTPQPNSGKPQFVGVLPLCLAAPYIPIVTPISASIPLVLPCVHNYVLYVCVDDNSKLTIGKTKGVSLMLKELKNCSDPKKCFDPNVFLDALQLGSLLPRMEVDASFYITNRARLEQMYPFLPQKEGMVAEVVYSILEHAVSKEEEARAVRDTCK